MAEPSKRDLQSSDSLDDTAAHPVAAVLPEAMFSTFSSDARVTPRDLAIDAANRVLGDYELGEIIGFGGMGVVVAARQVSTARQVALKLIRPDLWDGQSPEQQQAAVQRFRQEAKAAAQMSHPNIVTVYDVGEVEGIHFLSMQFVDGRDLAEVVRGRPLDDQSAADYMEPVSRAVHEAHQHGVLHRDLKPQNILIEATSNRPLVADFGVAKITESDSAMTRDGEAIGTPQYMAPEQTCGAANVTPRGDVYALGATLYHLLTGRPPFQASNPAETMRQVLMEDPIAPRNLNPSVSHDLETICLKCLEKEPSRRYTSAEELADELGRFRRGEPITARPISRFGRLVRWCNRNRLTAAFAASAAIFLIVALIGTTSGYISSMRARRESDKSLRQARNAVRDFFVRVSQEDLLMQPGLQPLRRDLLEQARAYHLGFLEDRRGDPLVQYDLAESHFLLGKITELIDGSQAALPAFHESRRLLDTLVARQPDNVRVIELMGDVLNAEATSQFRLGDTRRASNLFREAARYRQQLAQLHPDVTNHHRKLANVFMNSGLVAREAGDFETARKSFKSAQEIRFQLQQTGLDDEEVRRDMAKGHHNLAQLLVIMGDLPGAQRQAQAAIDKFKELADRAPENSSYAHLLAHANISLGDLQEEIPAALVAYRSAREVLEKLAADNPNVIGYRSELTELLLAIGQLDIEGGQWPDASQDLAQAKRLLEELLVDSPESVRIQRNLGVTCLKQAEVCLHQNRLEEAGKLIDRARQLIRELLDQEPENPDLIEQRQQIEALHRSIEQQYFRDTRSRFPLISVNAA